MAVLATAVAATAFTGCDNDFDYPPVVVPVATIEANTTIAEVKAAYWSDDRNYADTILPKETGERVIIAGRVTNNCASGNIYKSLIIEDETAALAISLNEAGLSTYYKVGQEVVIDVTDLQIGKYNGLQQLGKAQVYQSGYEVTFMDYDVFTEHAQVNGLPDVAKLDTAVVTMDEVRQMTSPEELQKWQSRLVRFDNVEFQGAGSLTFSEAGASTNRTLVDENGNRMTVRNSNYASFAGNIMPTGRGSVVCILSYYGTDWQLLIRDLSDCIGFDETGSGVDPVPPTAEANTSIDAIVNKYWKDDLNYATEIGKNDAGEDEIITARVISSDKAGNIFKQLFVQDGTGALMFAVNDSKLYQNYPYGQTININLTGMYIGRRQGLLQLGVLGAYNGTPQPDRMEPSEFALHASATGTADPNEVSIAAVTIDQLSDIRKWTDRIVRLSGVHFEQGGTSTFVVGGANTSQNVIDAQGRSVVLRTNSYASFATQTLPKGTGDIVAVVTYYNSTPQLVISDASDCQGFDSSDTPSTPSTPDVPTGTATFKKVTSITSGKTYVFVHNGQIGTAINATFSYGRLALSSVSIANDQLTTDLVNGIVITAVDGGYTLVDAYGRYLALDTDPAHTSNFQLYTSIQDGCTWTATADGANFKFINVLRPELVIAQQGTYTNIAPAPLTGENLSFPELYEKVD